MNKQVENIHYGQHKKKRQSKKPSLDVFREVCDAKGGAPGDIAQALGIRRSTLYSWLERDPEFADALNESRERLVDLAESRLFALIRGVPKIEIDENGEKRFAGWIEKPSETAIIFTLKTRGKKRGYVERSEIAADVNLRGSINIREWVRDRLQQNARIGRK